MKTLTALIAVLASLSTVDASKLPSSDQYAAGAEPITFAWNTAAESSAEGQCKAVCMLPGSAD